MTSSIFQFGNTWWKQLIGTAMGTPCACSYATLFYAFYERTFICPKYKSNLVLYKRYIDDIFFVWSYDPQNPNAFVDFKNDLNSQCKLDWTTPDLSQKLDFLDLTISINKGRFLFKTFQKPMNLYLYIPSHSAHPPGLLKSLIFGLISTYHRQNTFHSDFLHYSRLLYDRLLARGHTAKNIKPIFITAAERLEAVQRDTPNSRHSLHSHANAIKNHTSNTNPRNRLFFHLPFHPKDVSRQCIRDLYENTCETPDKNGESLKHFETELGSKFKIDRMTLAYHRPKNLRDLLSPSTLRETNTLNVNTVLNSWKALGDNNG